MKSRFSAVQHTLTELRSRGWTCCVVERWLPARGDMKFGRRIDAFGFGDILACWYVRDMDTEVEQKKIALVQTTTLSHMEEHKTEMLANPLLARWKEAGGIVILHGWRKMGPRGDRKTWQVAEEIL